MNRKYDVLAFGAHPDDLEAVMGGTALNLARKGLSVLFVDLCDGEPARHAGCGERHRQAIKAAEILRVERTVLGLKDRLITDTVEARLQVARLLRVHRPRVVFTTAGAGVHPDHKAVTDIVVHGVFYARLPEWDEIGIAQELKGTEPHEIDRLFFGHCRMEPAWDRFDFAVDVTDIYDSKSAALRLCESVFCRGSGNAARQIQCRRSLRWQPRRSAVRRALSIPQSTPCGGYRSFLEG